MHTLNEGNTLIIYHHKISPKYQKITTILINQNTRKQSAALSQLPLY
jgi:hypothetical protein